MKVQHLEHDGGKRAERTLRRPLDYEEHKFVVAAQKGDSIAFETLYKQSAGMAFNVARRIMRTPEDADDVVQESFQQAFIHLKSFKENSRFSTWLTRIVTNIALMRLRKNNAHRELSLEETYQVQMGFSLVDVRDQNLNPEQLCAQEERRLLVRKASSKLSPAKRSVVEMREFAGHSTEETSRIMGITVAAVKARVFHARKQLRQLLEAIDSKPKRTVERRRMDPCPNNAMGRQPAFNTGD